ncbi:hypothetical protein [Nocardia arizonensis]|nr:hypothetical protein [Nocardia arizonensis]
MTTVAGHTEFYAEQMQRPDNRDQPGSERAEVVGMVWPRSRRAHKSIT